MNPEIQNPEEPNIICACGKKYKSFYNYKNHLVKRKCQPETPSKQPDKLNPPEIRDEPILENTNTNQVRNPNPVQETTHRDIAQTQTEPAAPIAYKSSSNNINPKTKCDYCDKLYSNHHIKTHKQRCKHKYKETYEYKLLSRAGIRNIPETYIEVRELYIKLIEDNPGFFNDLPPDRKAFEAFERGLPQRGRPRKPRPDEEQDKNLNTPKKIYKRGTTTINNIMNNTMNNNTTNNTTNNNTINNIQQNNIQQNNINLFINPVYHESLAHITPERQMFIILQRLHAFKALIDSVYEIPSNQNIYISDRKGEKVNYLDKEHGINNGGSQDIIGNIAMCHLGTLDNFIETHKQDVPQHRQNDLKFLEDLLLNEKNNPCVIKQLNDKITSLSGSSKILLDNYQKQKIIDYIKSLPVGHFLPGDDDFNPELASSTNPEHDKLV